MSVGFEATYSGGGGGAGGCGGRFQDADFRKNDPFVEIFRTLDGMVSMSGPNALQDKKGTIIETNKQ
uniref:Uncharacterized protein n=1 Tax=Romanomermis culicivorax TaxID=13658 RepID=A0A915KDY7_ROMCU